MHAQVLKLIIHAPLSRQRFKYDCFFLFDPYSVCETKYASYVFSGNKASLRSGRSIGLLRSRDIE